MCVTVVCCTEEEDKEKGGQRPFHCVLEPRKWNFEAGSLHKEKPRKCC